MQKTIIGFTLLTAMGLSSGVYADDLSREVHKKMDPSYARVGGALSLSDSQVKDIAVVAEDHNKDILSVNNHMHNVRKLIETEFKKDQPDVATINKLTDDLSTAKSDKLKSNLKERLAIHNILTKEQRAKQDEIIKPILAKHIED